MGGSRICFPSSPAHVFFFCRSTRRRAAQRTDTKKKIFEIYNRLAAG